MALVRTLFFSGGLVFLGVVALGCQGPRQVSWRIRFVTPGLAANAAVVDARILEGSCTGPEIFGLEIRSGDSMTPRPPVLSPGTYCFIASAQDVDCIRFAESQVMIELPSDDMQVLNTLISLPDPHSQACPPSACDLGACRAADAGMPDAGPADAPIMRPDVCATSELDCANLADDDCDGSTDCSDSECVGMSACDACDGVMCPECQTCSSGSCVNVVDDTGCTDGTCHGGSCCQGCWDGSSCADGSADDALCGDLGEACFSCGECEDCNGGGCVSAPDRTACGGGTCVAGGCCTGCVDGTGTCVTATDAQCGAGGVDCAACGDCQVCTDGACEEAPPFTSCSIGRCAAGGTCCDGCLDVRYTCEPGNVSGACGLPGRACNTTCNCTSSRTCDNSRGEDCTVPIDITAPGDFPVDTCLFANNIDMACNAPGTPDIVLRGANPGNYEVFVPSDYIVQLIPSPMTGCIPDVASCGDYSSASGVTPDGEWMWVIERVGGGCGILNVHVHNT